MRSKHFETNTIHAGKFEDKQHGALSTPIYQTSTFIFDNVKQGADRFQGEAPGYIYSRLGNPTVRELEERMAVLEGTEDAAAAGSGMAAVSSAILAFVEAGDHIIASEALYGCSFALLQHKVKKFGIEVSFVDFTNPENLTAALQQNTKLVYFETPINPNLKVIDIEKVVEFAKKNNLISIADNTFMTPMLQNPAKMGADLVIHSATKYLNGHGDVVAGIICGSNENIELIKLTTLKDLGGIMSPHDAWLIIRGLKTLHIRMERHMENAQKVAEFLEGHEKVKKVYYPGLKSNKFYELQKKQARGASAVIGFDIHGDLEDGVAVMNNVKLCNLAVSLGDAETLIQHPASMTHSTYTPEEREASGISDDLIRISVGLEHIDDIIADLDSALSFVREKK
jgi:methionine-gamma-lyase